MNSITYDALNVIEFIAVVVGIPILYFVIKNALPSYFNEKGKNLATQEDISKITQLVEETKYQFTTQTELLKANLQINNNLQLNLKTEEAKSNI